MKVTLEDNERALNDWAKSAQNERKQSGQLVDRGAKKSTMGRKGKERLERAFKSEYKRAYDDVNYFLRYIDEAVIVKSKNY